MSAPGWIATVLVVFIALGLAQMALRRVIVRLGRRVDRESDPGATWTKVIVQRHRSEGTAFEVDVIYLGWPMLLGFAFGVASALGG